MSEIDNYCDKDMRFIFSNLNLKTKQVFVFIYQSYHQNQEGVNWKPIVEHVGERFTVERSINLLGTLGFITAESTFNNRNKKYKPHPTLGRQLAQALSEEQEQLKRK